MMVETSGELLHSSETRRSQIRITPTKSFSVTAVDCAHIIVCKCLDHVVTLLLLGCLQLLSLFDSVIEIRHIVFQYQVRSVFVHIKVSVLNVIEVQVGLPLDLFSRQDTEGDSSRSVHPECGNM